MPCGNDNHIHEWTTEGTLTIERCEKICGFCGKYLKHAWFVRRHVNNVHLKQYRNLKVEEGWTGSPHGNRRPGSSPQKRGRGHSRNGSNASSLSTVSTMDAEETVPEGVTVVQSIENVPPVAPTGNAVQSIEAGQMPHFIPETVADQAIILAGADMSNAYPALPYPQVPFGYDDHSLDFYDLAGMQQQPFEIPEVNEVDASNTVNPAMLTNNWVTPQYVRTSQMVIDSIIPSVQHHPVAKLLADGLNETIKHLPLESGMSAQEVLWVLETFADAYKHGIKFEMDVA